MASAFELYAKLARDGASLTDTQLAGRYQCQAEAERLIPLDVAQKLRLAPGDRLFEIGCGTGNLLLPLSFLCESALGMDNEEAVERLSRAAPRQNVSVLVGLFPQGAPQGQFDCVLAYSVIHYFTSLKQVEAFISAALELLAPGGRMLIGDIPNKDLKRRFLTSEAGTAFDKEWRASASARSSDSHMSTFGCAEMIGAFSDQQLLGIVEQIRSSGCNAYILPQPGELPFGHTREDILAVRPR